MKSSHLPILPKDLADNIPLVNGLVNEVKWKAIQVVASKADSQPEPGAKLFRPSTIADQPAETPPSLRKIGHLISNDAVLLSESANKVLLDVRDGVALGLNVARRYGERAGLRELELANRANRLTTNQGEEFRAKVATSAAVSLFAAASYIMYELGSYKQDKVSNARVEFHGVPEISLQNPVAAMQCMLYYLAMYLDPQKTGLVKSGLEMVAMTLKYAEGVIAEVANRKGSLKYTEFFTEVGYQLADTEFVIEGFESLQFTTSVSVEFRKQKFEDIVGNRGAKHEANRLALHLICYDLVAKKNPFQELGGVQPVRMGHGPAGTGKSMQIAATATLIDEYCKWLGIPFLFWPMPDKLISTFQGGSSEHMANWMDRLKDDNKIIYAPIDDGESNLEDRTRTGISAGVREVIGVFLRRTEGASAINRGNSVIEIFTNLPEQIDPAVLSRVQSRFLLNGAETVHDFIDQDYLWWTKIEALKTGFVNTRKPEKYEFMADQQTVTNLALIDNARSEKPNPLIRSLMEQIEKDGFDHYSHEFFGRLFAGVRKIYPTFTSRDVRNIQQAVSTRLMDFDLPKDWLEDADRFFRKDYETKLGMIKELMIANMGKHLTFADIRYQETLKYLDSLAMILNMDRERQITRRMEDMEIFQEATRRLQEKK